jgi:hypothetical protein
MMFTVTQPKMDFIWFHMNKCMYLDVFGTKAGCGRDRPGSIVRLTALENEVTRRYCFFSKSVNDVKGTTLTFVPSLMCCINSVAHMISLHFTGIAIKPWPRTTSKVGNSNLQITDIYIYRFYRYITWEKLQEAIELNWLGEQPFPSVGDKKCLGNQWMGPSGLRVFVEDAWPSTWRWKFGVSLQGI